MVAGRGSAWGVFPVSDRIGKRPLSSSSKARSWSFTRAHSSIEPNGGQCARGATVNGNQSIQAKDTWTSRDDCGDDRRTVEEAAGEITHVISPQYWSEEQRRADNGTF